jgi:hypothetical protein
VLVHAGRGRRRVRYAAVTLAVTLTVTVAAAAGGGGRAAVGGRLRTALLLPALILCQGAEEKEGAISGMCG